MERTYNVFVDNGLFVAANILDKKVENVTINDLKDNTKLFGEKVYKFTISDKYRKISSMSFHNSAFDQPAYRDNRKEKIQEQFGVIMDNIGQDEYCCICGNKNIEFSKPENFLTKLNRAFIINCVADTFYNHSNNLSTVNICPVCILLGMLSTLNMRKSGYIVLFNSMNNDFMYGLTQRRENEFYQKQFNNSGTKVDNTLELQNEILDLIVEQKGNDSLKVYKVNNGKGEFYNEELLSPEYIQLLYEIYSEGLIYEFNQSGLFYNMLKGNLHRIYLYKFIDFERCEIKYSKKLLMMLERELNKLNKPLNEIIQRICKKIYETACKDCLIKLKNVSNYNKFVELILNWQESYSDKKQESLLKNQEEFDIITDRKNYYNIKNKIMFELISNKGVL